MGAGAVSKTVASCVAYPHEVARTRLREEGSKYRTFWQTLYLVWREEGKAGLYRCVSKWHNYILILILKHYSYIFL